ncbi:MAG: response regulator [Treponema sp.]|jgi:two-component system response regulator YesN|nr:response regulator [Treponema sp.]
MYRILVVDDEDTITDSLAHMLESLTRFELDVYRAYSAAEALARLEKMAVDIVITDIQMPGKTGLELLRDIRASWPDCQVIFLTGYNEFEYAAHAVNYHAARYILKTEGYEPIIEAVAASIETIEREERNTAILETAREQVDRYLPLARRNFLGALLSGEMDGGQDLSGDFKRLEISLDPGAPVMLLAARIHPAVETDSSIDQAVRKKILGGIHVELAWTGAHIITWVLQYRSSVSTERTHARAMIKGMAEYVQRFRANIPRNDISFVFDSKPAAWPEIAGRFAELKFVVMNRLESGAALTDMNYFLIAPLDAGSGDTRPGYKEGLRKLTLALNLDDEEKLQRAGAELSRSIGEPGGMELAEFNTALNAALLSYITGRSLGETVRNDNGLRLFLSGALNDEGLPRLNQFTALACRLIGLNRRGRRNSLSQRILACIQENPGADLSLYALSEKFFLNPSYLSRRFKEETGKNITDTVLELRLEEACRLLKETERKINRIAVLVGYESPAYFSNIFKRRFGVSPQEYRGR